MTSSFGDVVVVPFPFVDMAVAKRRPALVVSNQSFNANNNHTVLAMITTARASSWPSDIAIVDQEAAGLRHASVIRWKVFTLPNGLVGTRLGALGPSDRRNATAMVRRSLAPEP